MSGWVECLEWTIPDPTKPHEWAILCRVCGWQEILLRFGVPRDPGITPRDIMERARKDHAACIDMHEARLRKNSRRGT